jgi:methionyl-tRNA formyltransferase
VTLRIVLVGQEAPGAQLLRALHASSHEVVAVLTQEPDAKGGPASLSGLATRLGLETLPAALVRDPAFARRIRAWSVDLLLNVHSLYIIRAEILESPRIGSFNLHPGPLPEYAGLNTVGWAIYNGETMYGVTVHWMVPRLDAGPIAFQDRFPIPPDATALRLGAECTRRGVALLLRLVEYAAIDPRSVPASPQDPQLRRYYARDAIPQGGRVDWTQSAAEIDRFVRAFDYGPFASPWGRPFTDVDGRRVEIARLHRTSVPNDEPAGARRTRDGSLWIAARDEWIDLGVPA